MIFIIFIAFLALITYILFSNLDRLKNLLHSQNKPVFNQGTYLTFILLTLAFNLFLYGTSNSLPFIGFALFNLLALTGLFFIYPPKKRTPFTLSLFAVSLISAFLPIFRANGFIQGLNYTLTLTSNLLLILILTYDTVFWQLLWLTKNFLKLPFKYLGHMLNLLSPSKLAGNPNTRPPITKIIKTTLISLVVFALFTSLLSAADPIFERLLKQIFEESLGRIIGSLILVSAAAVITSLRLNGSKNCRFKLTSFSLTDLVIPTGIAILLFTTFLIIQARYLFASQEVFATLDLTYSEYVRRGFTELLTTAFLGGLIAYFIALKTRLSRHPLPLLKAINFVLILELFLMLASALKRNFMYMDVYGLTRVRLIGGYFLFWLSLLLLTLLLLTFLKRFREKHLFAVMWLTSLVVWLGLNTANIDNTIATQAPGHHDYIDHFYLQNLSEDAFGRQQALLPALEQDIQVLTSGDSLTDIKKSQLAGLKLALITLKEKRLKLFKKYADPQWQFDHYSDLYPNPYLKEVNPNPPDEQELQSHRHQIKYHYADWRQHNLPQYQAFQTLWNQPHYAPHLDQLLTAITTYQEVHQIDLDEQERRLLYDFKYPFINIYLQYTPQALTTHTFSSQDIQSQNYPASLKTLMAQNQPTVTNIPISSQARITLNAIITKNPATADRSNPYAVFEISDLSTTQPHLVYAPKSQKSTLDLLDLISNSAVPVTLTLAPFTDTYQPPDTPQPLPIEGHQITTWSELKLLDRNL